MFSYQYWPRETGDKNQYQLKKIHMMQLKHFDKMLDHYSHALQLQDVGIIHQTQLL